MIMKNKWILFGFVGITGVLVSSFALVQKEKETQEPKKSRHIKMMKIENGKKMELDTVLTGDNVFVWNGDTINMNEDTRKIGTSGFQRTGVSVDHQNGNKKVMIIKHQGGKKGNPAKWNIDSCDDMEILTEDIDSVGKRIVIRKRVGDGQSDELIFMNDGHEMLVPPPPPPPPPFPHMKAMKMQHGGQIIDLNDPEIVSYKKKDLKGGMEKIEIIRKKSTKMEDTSFNFHFDDELMPPEAPDAPEFNWESDGDSLRMKIMETRKVVKGKNGKEIEVKIETEENK